MNTEPTTKALLNDIFLVVDLDGTLCRTHMLREALLVLAATRRQMLLRLPGWLRGGRAGLKARLADLGVIAPGDCRLTRPSLKSSAKPVPKGGQRP